MLPFCLSYDVLKDIERRSKDCWVPFFCFLLQVVSMMRIKETNLQEKAEEGDPTIFGPSFNIFQHEDQRDQNLIMPARKFREPRVTVVFALDSTSSFHLFKGHTANSLTSGARFVA